MGAITQDCASIPAAQPPNGDVVCSILDTIHEDYAVVKSWIGPRQYVGPTKRDRGNSVPNQCILASSNVWSDHECRILVR